MKGIISSNQCEPYLTKEPCMWKGGAVRSGRVGLQRVQGAFLVAHRISAASDATTKMAITTHKP